MHFSSSFRVVGSCLEALRYMHRSKDYAFGNQIPRGQALSCVWRVYENNIYEALVSSANNTLAVRFLFPQCFCGSRQQSSEAVLLKKLANIFQRARP